MTDDRSRGYELPKGILDEPGPCLGKQVNAHRVDRHLMRPDARHGVPQCALRVHSQLRGTDWRAIEITTTQKITPAIDKGLRGR